MPVIRFSGQQFPLQPGPNRVGGGATADVNVGDDVIGVQAVVELAADGRATIRRSGDKPIKVNGMDLGQPTPLIHGDKVEIAGQEMYFADDAKVGATQFVSASDVSAIAAAKRSGPARGTLASGGRLVSLVDGKEYPVPEAGVVIGRDAGAEIVVAQTSVSRRHAQVIPSANGYVVNDLSTNGITVNGEKVNGSQALSRSDVIRVGTEEFRFYADLAPAAKSPAAPAPVAPTPQPAAPVPPATVKPAGVATAPRPVSPPPAPAPAAAAVAAPVATASSKAATPPARPVTPPPVAPATRTEQPVTISKGVPMWAGLLVVIAVAAVAAYFILQR